MTAETTTHLSPTDVIELARSFFTGPDAVFSASIEEADETHLVLNTYRSRIVVAAFPDPGGSGETRVRVSTLREDAVAGRFLTYVRTADSPAAGEAADRPAGS